MSLVIRWGLLYFPRSPSQEPVSESKASIELDGAKSSAPAFREPFEMHVKERGCRLPYPTVQGLGPKQ